jgi:hypothetical protein
MILLKRAEEVFKSLAMYDEIYCKLASYMEYKRRHESVKHLIGKLLLLRSSRWNWEVKGDISQPELH